MKTSKKLIIPPLPSKARCSIFNGRKDLENFINDIEVHESIKFSSPANKIQRPSNYNKEMYYTSLQSIYEKLSIKKKTHHPSTTATNNAILSKRNLKKSIFNNLSMRALQEKKKKYQYFLSNNIIDFEKIEKFYYDLKHEETKYDKKPSYFLEVEEVFSLGSILKEYYDLKDEYPLLLFRKVTFLFIQLLCWVSLQISKNNIFLILFNYFIIMDCLLLSFDYYDNHIMLENFLIFFYNFEAIIKILGEGFYFDRNAYFKDKWNIFDFILNILMSIYKIIINNTGEKIRVLQIMRFFKILKIAPIKLICLKLASTFSLLAETFLLILIFCLFYALWALHLFAGLLKQSCFYKETGLLDELKTNIFCGNLGFECPFNMICGKMLANPDYGASNYDNIMFSLLQVFKIMTLDDWTASMFSLQQTFSKYVWLYFVSLVILGNFFIMNLILAVLKVKYSQADLNYTLKTKETENMIYDLKELKDKNIIRKRGNRLETIAIKSKNKKSILDKLKMVDITGKNEEIEKKYRLIPVKYSSKRVMRFNQKFKVLLLLINRWFWTLYNRMKSQAIKNLNFIKRSQLQIRVKTELKYDSMNINDVLPKRKEDLLNYIHEIIKRFNDNTTLNIEYNINNETYYQFINKISHSTFEHLFETHRLDLKLIINDLTNSKSQALPLKKKQNRNYLIDIQELIQKRKNPRETNINIQVSNPMSELIVTRRNKVLLMQINSRALYKNNTDHQTKISIKKKNIKPSQFDEIDKNNINISQSMRSTEVRSWNYDQFARRISENVNNEYFYNKIEDFQEKYYIMRFQDLSKKGIIKHNWSGHDVLLIPKIKNTLIKIFNALNNKKIMEEFRSYKTKLGELRKILINILRGKLFQDFYSLFILINAIILCLEGNVDNKVLYIIQTCLTFFYLIEFTLKISLYTMKTFLKDKINIIDLIALIYLTFSRFINENTTTIYDEESETDLFFIIIIKYIRFFKMFLILKILRLFKYVYYMIFIQNAIKQTISKFLYNAIILVLVILTYSGYGYRIYKNEISYFKEYSYSMITVLQIITLDNWYVLFAECYGKTDKSTTLFFFISLIIIGNYILLNLFIALVLDSFENMSQKEYEIDFNEEKEEKPESEEENIIENIHNKRNLIFKNQNFSQFLTRIKSDIDYEIKTFKKKIPFIEDKPHHKNFDRASIGTRTILSDKDINLHLLRKMQKKINADQIKYKEIDEKFSLFIFGKKTKIRKFCFFATQSYYFQKIVNLCILFNSMKLAIDSFNIEEFRDFSFYVDRLFFVLFLIEAIFKTIGYGFIFGKDSYLRNPFNCLNFGILIGFPIFGFVEDLTNPLIRTAILLRLISPIRIIYESPSMKIIVFSLFESFSKIINIMITVLLVWVAFAVIGMVLFRGRFGYCENLNNFAVSKEQCLSQNKSWIIYPYNFDTFLNALFLLFIVSTLDNWTRILYVAVNSHIETIGPIKDNNQFSSYLYFCSFIIIGVWFFLNLLFGVIFSNFLFYQKKYNKHVLNENQLKWLEIQKDILNMKNFKLHSPLKGIRKIANNITNSKWFQNSMIILLFLNFICLAISYDDSPKIYYEIFSYSTFFFTIIANTETILKITGLGLVQYFKTIENNLNFMLGVSYLIDTIIEFYIKKFINDNPMNILLYRASKIFRLLPLLRMITYIKSLYKIFKTLALAFSLLLALFVLLLLTFFIYAIIGCFIFKGIQNGKIYNKDVNFNNIFYAMLTLFKCNTSDDWSEIVFDTFENNSCDNDKSTCGSNWSYVYFVSFMIITNYILLNMFVLVILQQFESFHKNPKNPIFYLKYYLETFKNDWIDYCLKNSIKKINYTQILNFLRIIQKPLGITKNSGIMEYGRKIIQMNMIIDKNNNISFKELAHLLIKIHLQENYFFDELNEISMNELEKKEMDFHYQLALKILLKKTIKRREEIRKKSTFSGRRRTKKKKKSKKKYEGKLEFHTANPFFLYLISLMCLRSWQKYSLLKSKKSENHSKESSLIVASIPLVKNQSSQSDAKILTNKSDENYNKTPTFFFINQVNSLKNKDLDTRQEQIIVHSFEMVPNYIKEENNQLI